ncbi:MAG TPA: NADH-quinone oxidoreductase subunit A [Microthrixaceae bacterium]|nr:NADH-quinone oxidoreductase subunit A [Microthrixaceae bacterium]
MAQYLPLLALLILTALFGFLSLVASRLLNPPRPTPAKTAPYECGIVDQTDPPERFPVRFYLIAMIFIVFDIEIVFMYPFTMVFEDLGGYGLAIIAIFSVAVFESFLYLISNGALDWGPVKRLRHGSLVDADRTARTTVRRVGLEGRQHVGVLSTPIVDEPTPGEAA